jgi:AraC-like DNA-binding protein
MPRPPSKPSPSADFASAALLRVLHQGLLDAGLPAPPQAAPRGATVSLDDKRALLMHAVQHGGLACLPRLGQAVSQFRHEPLHQALVSARNAHELVERWCRLERYLHSRHRIVIDAHSATHLVLRHLPRQPGPPPLAAEDLVVLGLLLGFLHSFGLLDLRAAAGPAPVWPACDAPALNQAAAAGQTGTWRIEWSASVVPAQPLPPLCRPPDATANTPDASWPPLAQAAYQAVCAHLIHPPDLATLAQDLGLSPRHLQRQLQAAGLSFRTLLAEARYRHAGQWLMHSASPLAEVGFVCGYADQSHFTREFRQRSGLTPAGYRAEFGLVTA